VQLAQQAPHLNIIGLGAQDAIEQANDFVARTATEDLTMVWDPSFDSWRHFGVRSQPYWILFDANGDIIESRPGAIDFDAVRDAL